MSATRTSWDCGERTTAGCERHNKSEMGRLVGAMNIIASSGWHGTDGVRRWVLHGFVTCEF